MGANKPVPGETPEQRQAREKRERSYPYSAMRKSVPPPKRHC